MILISFLSLSACAQYPSVEWQISTAILACPEEFREHSTVLGYREKGVLEVLRSGTNNMICLADNPETDGFNVSSYHSDLEPFMKRGRELTTQGFDFKTIFDIRESEAKSGALKMPSRATLYVLSGDINDQNKEIENTYLRYVIYIPFATPESTGLPTKPAIPSEPWIMDPGTHRAHIMISPQRKK
ncbi:MAG: hypothetical protein CMB82_03180 [Flammeovirgaceae bacterium]|nr:hypothetical protein [Flammeovirgaceae bacterium]